MRLPRNRGINRLSRGTESAILVCMRGSIFPLPFGFSSDYSFATLASSGSMTGMSSRTG
jgi:hypothetical protein